MNKEEVIKMLNILKESSENTIGNRIDKGQNYTILSNIPPNSFSYVIDAAISEIKKCKSEDPKIIPDAIKLDKDLIIKKDEEGKQEYIDTYIDLHTEMFGKVRDNY